VLPPAAVIEIWKQMEHRDRLMPKLTKRTVDAAEVRSSEYFVWDDELPGFGLRVFPSGRKGYIVQYRTGRRSRRISLGPSAVLACEQARNRAMTIVAAARNGEDPAAKRDTDRKAIAITELADRFDKEHIALRVKESTAREYRRNLKRFILPALGRFRVNEVTRADVAKFHHDLRHIPYQANRCLENHLEDVQPRRDVGLASRRIEPAQAHQKIRGGEA
jgi:Arm DNA-binding domain/Phage integrase, N-terminal SAM-like domain